MAQGVVDTLNRATVADLHYDVMEIDPSEILEGEPVWEFAKVWSSADGRVVAGSFKSTPGRFRITSQIDEIVNLIEGTMTITSPDGTSIECGPGDLIQLKRGETYVYDVHVAMIDYVVMVGDEPLGF